ncbi:citrate lyase beta subunit [Jatrophihabitans sp. GAS493]|uniref:HpcH/HpaI aldolase/citrate lyase family protein n=1 Tax=Jatrophihabitans sp. GAS493 TaxID=1907575 RepID=UPI000BB81843|nr:HpcH/HpaI aldolase/citrate lyase family protein [Jatrophihabitans sp. GAS493]SOD71741.1 citrate lyase beta subunit [Jatrophihabitans sp. GAS493]
MRHFHFLNESERSRLFHREPQDFSADGDSELLAIALGATLYTPGTRRTLADDLAKRNAEGLVSSVICLEDSVPDDEVDTAEVNVVAQIREYARRGGGGPVNGPLIFVRVRSADQIATIVTGLGEHVDVLTGFVLPKFTPQTGPPFLESVEKASAEIGRQLLAMPVIESPEVIFAESRIPTLLAIRDLLRQHRQSVLAVRIGATDLSSVYGLRRARGLTVYDVRIIADVIADVVNVIGRRDTAGEADGADEGFIVTGPVWEYFAAAERIFKPQLRESPFIVREERALRTQLIAKDLDGLIREVALDKANGLTGKTVIHPTHVAAVHALSVVTHEEFVDALDVVGTAAQGGAAASPYNNKMNESKPHAAWARRILLRARVFGVANPEVSFVDLLGAGLHL